MRRDNNRRLFNLNNQDKTKRMFFISAIILILAMVAFFITFIIYGNILRNDDELAKINSKSITDLGKSSSNMQTEQASYSMGKSINDVKEDINNSENSEEKNTKIAINTSNMEKEDNTIQNTSKNENDTNKTKTTNNKVEELKELTFTKPVQGEIIRDFAKDTLIYSETLKEWITHMGIDIKADKTTVVKSAEDGIIKSIKNDPRYGITVVIEHAKGYVSVYSNLLTAEFVKEGEKVSKGQTIGTVGNTATFEIADEPHLHFEILKDGEYQDPNLYLK